MNTLECHVTVAMERAVHDCLYPVISFYISLGWTNRRQYTMLRHYLGLWESTYDMRLISATYGHPMEYGRPLYFHLVVSSSSSFYLSFFSRLFSAVAHWMSTILLHMV